MTPVPRIDPVVFSDMRYNSTTYNWFRRLPICLCGTRRLRSLFLSIPPQWPTLCDVQADPDLSSNRFLARTGHFVPLGELCYTSSRAGRSLRSRPTVFPFPGEHPQHSHSGYGLYTSGAVSLLKIPTQGVALAPLSAPRFPLFPGKLELVCEVLARVLPALVEEEVFEFICDCRLVLSRIVKKLLDYFLV